VNAFFRNNNVLRVMAILIACILWLTVSSQNHIASTQTVASGVIEKFPFAIHVESDESLVLTKISQATGMVIVNGSILNAATLPTKMLGVELVANAHGLTPGKHIIQVAALGMPNASYTISPATIIVDVEKRVSIRREVHVLISGSPAAGYQAGSPSTDLTNVSISGSPASIQQVASVSASISLSGITRPVSKLVNLVALNAQGEPVSGVSLSPQVAVVTVPILTAKQTLRVLPQVVGNPALGFSVAGVSLLPGQIDLLEVPSDANAPADITIPVNVEGMTKTQTITVTVPVVGDTKASPATIQATIQIEPSQARVFAQVPIGVTNLANGQTVKLIGKTKVDVSIVGPASIVSQMTAADIQVYIVGNRLTASDTTATLDVVLPQWVTATQMSAAKVSVNVTMK